VANQFIFADWVAMETLREFKNKSQVAQFFNTDYNKEFTKNFAIGDTVRVPIPQRFLITNGLQYQEQPIDRRYVTVAFGQPFGVHFGWDDMEAMLKLDRPDSRVKKEYIDKAASQIAAELDSRCALWALQNTPNLAGVLGVVPTAPQTYGALRTRLVEQSGFDGHGKKGLIITPSMEETIGANVLTNFNPQKDISQLYKEGSLGKFQGFDSYVSNQLFQQTAGTIAGTNTTNGANQSGSNILVNMGAGDTYFVGDIFTIANVYYVNPVSRRTTGRLKQFVVTQAYTGLGTSADNLNIYPSIEGPGSQYQNVDSLPAASANLVMYPGTTSPNGKVGMQGIALTEDAFALVGLPLEKPRSQEMASSVRDPATGISMRFVKSWDQPTSSMRHRLETVIGFGTLLAEQCACRMMSLT
jgi:hypothetical protein